MDQTSLLKQLKVGKSHGLVVKADGSRSRGSGFKPGTVYLKEGLHHRDRKYRERMSNKIGAARLVLQSAFLRSTKNIAYLSADGNSTML